jgi:type IV pilus assembly protein PilE
MHVSDARNKGFTLIELVVSVCIVALLLTLTLPSYQKQLRSTRRSLGSAELQEVLMRQEQYFLDRKRYANTLTALGFPASPYSIDAQGNALPALTTDSIYLIELSLQQDAYTVHAIPQFGQAADSVCGTLSIDSMGTKRAAAGAAVRECW